MNNEILRAPDSKEAAVLINTRNGSERLLIDGCYLRKVQQLTRITIYTDSKGRKLARAGKEDDQVLLHRYLYDIPKGYRMEWVNGDSLDLRRINVRLVDRIGDLVGIGARKPPRIPTTPAKTPTPLAELDTAAEKVKGVTFHKASKKWHSRPYWDGTRYSLGYFNTLAEANTETRIFMQEGPDSPKLKRNQKRGN